MAAWSSKPSRIDDLLPPWGRSTTPGTECTVLPDYPWMGVRSGPVASDTGVVVGAIWRVCVDLVAERINNDRSTLRPRGLRSTVRYRGRPVEAVQVATLEGYRHPLVLLEAGSLLRVQKLGGSVGWDWGGWITSDIWFELPGGRRLVLATGEVSGELGPGEVSGLTWSQIACAAAIVPLGHGVATDSAACAETLARVEAAAFAA